MQCKLCGGKSEITQILTIRQKYEANYFRCGDCGLIFADNPIWLEESYAEPINITDTGYVTRNVYLSRKTLILFYFLFGKQKTYLDYAGGYGMLTRLMRDYGLNFFHTDLYAQNLFAQGFEYKDEKIDALTCFECFEHLSDPAVDIEKMFSISSNIFFSTLLIPADATPDKDWEYYGVNHGQHVAFYSVETLKFIAKKYNVNLYTNGTNLHLFTKKKFPNIVFKILLACTKIQLDLFIRKLFIKSKLSTDSQSLKDQGY